MKYDTISLDDLALLIPSETEALNMFCMLEEETQGHISAIGRSFHFSPDPDGIGNFLSYPVNISLVPPELVLRWRQWNADYSKLVDRNPQISLYWMLSEISSVDSFSSWPNPHLEVYIQFWIDGGIFRPLPFDERGGEITEEFYRRLRTLRAQCDGWLYCDASDKVRFVLEPEWHQVRSTGIREPAFRRVMGASGVALNSPSI